MVRLSGEGWPGVRAGRAESFLDRLHGIRAVTDGDGVLLDRTSIHTIGLDRSLAVVAVDGEMTVIESRLVPPNRFARFRDASFVLEVDVATPLPPSGTRIVIQDE